MTVLAPYALENLQIDGFDVVLNKPKTAAYRAPGATNAAFATETVIDELVEKLGIDSLRIPPHQRKQKKGLPNRLGRNLDALVILKQLKPSRIVPTINLRCQDRRMGSGEAVAWLSGFWINAGFQSSATVSINTDGTANVVTGSPDIGGTRTSCAMIAAEVLGLKAEEVHPVVADTESIGHTDTTGGSRVTFATGYAVYEAAQDAVNLLKQRAATLWKAKPEEIVYQDGVVSCTTNGHESMTLKELAGKLPRAGGPVTGRASMNPRGVGPAFTTHLVDVEVDVETGKVDILRYTAAQDVARPFIPVMSKARSKAVLRKALAGRSNEEYFYDENGTMRNTGFLDYRMPTDAGSAMIEAILVEVPNPGHPIGIRGVGEVPIVPPPAAIANAITVPLACA